MESATNLTEIEKRRYLRQIMFSEIGEEGQLKLKNAKVLVIGAGSAGNTVLQYLTSAGVGTIGICDADYVHESLFHRQTLYGNGDLGKLKTIVAKEKLKLINPYVNFNIHNILLNEKIAETIIKDYQIVVDCIDNFETSSIINNTTNALSIPVVYGMSNKFEGYVGVFNSQVKNDFSRLKKKYGQNPQSENGIIGFIPGIVGLLQTNEVIKIILGLGEVLSEKLLKFDALKAEFSYF